MQMMIKSFVLAVLIVALAVSGVVRRVAAAAAAAAAGWWLFADAFRHSSTLSLF
jgi:hypothetical protein